MKIKIPLRLSEPADGNFHLIVTSEFGDKTTGYWVLDTGATQSVFDKTLEAYYFAPEEKSKPAQSTGIGDKIIDTAIARMKPFSIEKLHIDDLQVALIDLTHINNFYPGSTNIKICGLLGSDFLMHHKAVIDYQKKVLILNIAKGFRRKRSRASTK